MEVVCNGLFHCIDNNDKEVVLQQISRKGEISVLSNFTFKEKLIIFVSVTPDSIPSFKSMEKIAFAFALAEKLKDFGTIPKVSVVGELVETKLDSQTRESYEGVNYYKNINISNKARDYIQMYKEIFNYYREMTEIPCTLVYQWQINNMKISKKVFKDFLKFKLNVLDKYDIPSDYSIRLSCPKCGLTEKTGFLNVFKRNTIINRCPIHSDYKIRLRRHFLDDISYNTKLRNLIRSMTFDRINTTEKYKFNVIKVCTNKHCYSVYKNGVMRNLKFYTEDIFKDIFKRTTSFSYKPISINWEKTAYPHYASETVKNYETLLATAGFEGLDIVFDYAKDKIGKISGVSL